MAIATVLFHIGTYQGAIGRPPTCDTLAGNDLYTLKWHSDCWIWRMKLTFILCLLLATTTFTTRSAGTSASAPASAARTATNELTEAKIPERNFTNSVGMELVQGPGGYWAGRYDVH